jgi:hypothetical protein
VSQLDVIEIHHHVREAVCENIRRIHCGEPSRVVILAGNPGMANQRAIVAYSHFLEQRITDDPAIQLKRFMDAMEGTQAQFQVTRDRVTLFLEQARAQAGAIIGH